MIVPNGFIQTCIVSGGGFSSNGNPATITETWSENIPCRIQTNTYDKKGIYKDGKFTQCSYLIFAQKKLSTSKIKLLFNDTETEFTVQSIEFLSLVGHTKITV